ncbi:MAG: metalloregulator ArsR/SmtB family transcription factor [Gammaproteobacteria bacterium]|jgi:ArsR family transcriptional regulator|nr:metalloregulator ArsR/SmtB family transcription factor [Gammaproteobacteria bacterium]
MQPSALFRCLGEEIRLTLLLLVRRHGELCVCELVEAVNASQPKVSRHLAQLRSCGLLQDCRRGQWVYYSVSPDLPAWVGGVLDLADDAHAAQLQGMEGRLQAMAGRPSLCNRPAGTAMGAQS